MPEPSRFPAAFSFQTSKRHPGTAQAATSPTNFRVTEAVPVDDIIGGMGELFDGSTTGSFPTIGRATMEVESFFEYNFDGSYGSGFAVTFTTSNGDRLTLASPFVPNTFFLSSGNQALATRSR